MNVRRIISKNKFGQHLIEDIRYRTVTFALYNLLFNLLYAAYNGVLGVIENSYWFKAMCTYHIILSIMRFSAILTEKKHNIKKEYSVMKLTGILLALLSFILSGIVYMCVSQDIARKYSEIIMITIATYTFYKITMAVIRAVKYRSENSPVMSAIRSIGYAEIAVSVLTMQMSMLISFEDGTSSQDIYILNLLTGIGVCLFTLALGIIMIKNSNKKEIRIMAKSKIVKANEKIAEKVVDAYKKVEETVVDGYKKIEDTVVGGYAKIEDTFVDKYLTKDGESIEEAKARLKEETKNN